MSTNSIFSETSWTGVVHDQLFLDASWTSLKTDFVHEQYFFGNIVDRCCPHSVKNQKVVDRFGWVFLESAAGLPRSEMFYCSFQMACPYSQG